MQSPHQVTFDNKGDIRWYTTDVNYDTGYSLKFNDDQSRFVYFRNELTSNTYGRQGEEMVEADWLGKIYFLDSNASAQSDHDSTLIPGDKVLYIHDGMSNEATIYCLDMNTGKSTPWLVMKDVFDSSVDPCYPDWNDLWHVNTVNYVEGDDAVIISSRNQSMVFEVSLRDGGTTPVTADDIMWALTPLSNREAAGQQSALAGKYITPTDQDFDWFYEQHDANVISNDTSTGIMEIVLFDNGLARYNAGDPVNDEQYSRGVIYRIDKKNKTVTLVRDYGKDRSELYSFYRGGARVIASNGHLVTCFAVDGGNTNKSRVVESDDKGNVVAEYKYSSSICGAYRTIVSTYGTSFSNYDLTSTKGVENHDYEQSYWEKTSLGDTSDLWGLSLTQLTRDDDTLSIIGTAKTAKGASTASAKVLASSSDGTYSFDLLTLDNGGFYGRGIPTSSLPDGTYSLYLSVTSTSGGTVTQSLGRTLTIGKGAAADVTLTTSLPDGTQEQKLEGMLSAAKTSSFQDMSVVQDPFGTSPLTAMALFSTDDLCSVDVTAHGQDANGRDDSSLDVSYDIEGSRTLHEIEIVGLYYDRTTRVTLTLTHADGTTEEKELNLSCGTADAGLPDLKVSNVSSDTSSIAPGLTFCASPMSYYYAVDRSGAVRWYYSQSASLGASGINFTSDDHLLVADSLTNTNAKKNGSCVHEIDLVGREYQRYYAPDMAFHHEVKELDNGNLICAMSDTTRDTVEDVVIELDRKTGEVVNKWDLTDILVGYGLKREEAECFGITDHLTDADGSYDQDWIHNNCVCYNDNGTPDDESDDYMLISSRHQCAVFKMKLDGTIEWVLGDPTGFEGTQLAAKCLTPTGDGFEWQYAQHAPMVCSDGDILLFDNGCYRTKTTENMVAPADNYSRVVRYRVDESNMTVEQVYSFGKGLGSDHYCCFIGDADGLPNGDYLGTFGGHSTDANGDVSDTPMGGAGGSNDASVIESDKDGNIVWELDAEPNAGVRYCLIYRSERKQITKLAYTYGDAAGITWKGTAGPTPATDVDLSSFTEGTAGTTGGVTVTDVGNRTTVAGSLRDPSAVKDLYVVTSDGSITKAYPATVASSGAFSVSLTYGVDELSSAHDLSLAVVHTDGTSTIERIATTPAVQTFSAVIGGSSSMDMGATQTLSLTSFPGSVDCGSNATWTSSDPSVATVDESGFVSAVSTGTTIITAATPDNGTRAQLAITVVGAALDHADLTLRVDEAVTLEDVSIMSDGSHVSSWAVADSGIATVEDGLVTGKEIGETDVTAIIGDKTLTCHVTVVPTVEDGAYSIASKLDETKVVDIDGGSTSNGGNAQIYVDNQTPSQLFNIKYVSEGYYTVSPQCSDKMLDVAGGGTADGTNVQQYSANQTESQLWKLKDQGNGYWAFVSAKSGKVLDVSGGSTQNRTNLQTWTYNGTDSQSFKLVKRFVEGIYRIGVAGNSRLAVDISGSVKTDGGNAQVYTWNNSYAQEYLVRYDGAGAYTLTCLASAKVLDVAGGSSSNGANVQQYTANGSSAQRWYLRQQTDGTYKVISERSGKCMDVAGGSLRYGSNLQQYTDNDTIAQRFTFTSVASTYTVSLASDSNLVLDVSGGRTSNGANVQIYKRNGSISQKFLVTQVGQSSSRVIVPLVSLSSLDAAGGGTSNGTNVQQWSYNATGSQMWYVQYVGRSKADGKPAYRIVNDNSRLVLDVAGGVLGSGTNVQLWKYNGTASQLFRLTAAQ
jgi:hypothetical protein